MWYEREVKVWHRQYWALSIVLVLLVKLWSSQTVQIVMNAAGNQSGFIVSCWVTQKWPWMAQYKGVQHILAPSQLIRNLDNIRIMCTAIPLVVFFYISCPQFIQNMMKTRITQTTWILVYMSPYSMLLLFCLCWKSLIVWLGIWVSLKVCGVFTVRW